MHDIYFRYGLLSVHYPISYGFDEVGVQTLLCFDHIKNISHFFLRSVFQRQEEFYEIIFIIKDLSFFIHDAKV